MVGIGTYLKEDYNEILNISEDRDSLDETWEDWKTNKERTKNQLRTSGIQMIDVIVRPAELVKYCRERGGNKRRITFKICFRKDTNSFI